MSRDRQPLEAAVSGLVGLDVWLAPDLGMRHPTYDAVRGTLNSVRGALQRALDDPHGDAADAEIASRHLRTLTALRVMLPDLRPKPADLIDLEDRLDWVCEQLVRAGGRAAPA